MLWPAFVDDGVTDEIKAIEEMQKRREGQTR